jgi:hypothetical protein
MRGLRLLLLPCPAERRFKYLRSDAQSTSLFDNRRVYRQCRTVDLNAVLREDDGLARVRGKTTRDGEAPFRDRSGASAAIRVSESRMRLTNHFSPSFRLSRAERSREETTLNPTCT